MCVDADAGGGLALKLLFSALNHRFSLPSRWRAGERRFWLPRSALAAAWFCSPIAARFTSCSHHGPVLAFVIAVLRWEAGHGSGTVGYRDASQWPYDPQRAAGAAGGCKPCGSLASLQSAVALVADVRTGKHSAGDHGRREWRTSSFNG
jgi:hypothetical protein